MVSTNIYARLLPGVSNQTERARYFSFYPWVFNSFARHAPDKSPDGWRTWIRRHDLTFAAAGTAAEIAAPDDEPAGGTVGSRAAKRMLKADGAIDIAASAGRPGGGKPTYFKHREGGYGQYYKAPMTALGLFAVDEERKAPDRRLTTNAGVRVASVLDGIREFRDLRDLAAAGLRVSQAELAALGRHVHPREIDSNGTEARLLRALLLGDDHELCAGQDPVERVQRRQSFALALDYLAQADDGGWNSAVWGFRWCVLERRLGDDRAWAPLHLGDSALSWAAYAQNELLTYGLENLLWSVLQLLDEHTWTPAAIAHEIAAAAVESLSKGKNRVGRRKLPGTLYAAVAALTPPSSDAAWGPDGTHQLYEDLETADDPHDAAGRAVRLLLRVASDRDRYRGRHPFETIPGWQEIVRRRELHLRGWWDRVDAAANTSTVAFFEQLILDWIIYRHLRVATRKLAAQGDYTYLMRPEEGVLVKCGDFDPSFTNPRLRQCMRIMADVGLVSASYDAILPHGRALLEGST